MGEFKAGDRVVFCRGKKNNRLDDITVGKTYMVLVIDNYTCIIDDVENYYVIGVENNFCKPTKIIE